MNKIIKNNKIFLGLVILLIISASIYKVYKINNVIDITNGREKVTILLRSSEITKGLPDLVEKFNEENEKIYIKLEFSADDYNNILLTKSANEIGADIVEYFTKTQIEKDFIIPLDNIGIDYSKVGNANLLKYNNEIIGVKYGSPVPKLMFNDDILTEAGLSISEKPKTLDELISMLQIIKDKVPDVTPFNITIANIHDLFSLLGNMAATEDSIYPTFWNYETGQYDYSGLDVVLQKFKYMYDNELINLDFDEKTEENLLDEFENNEVAVTYVNSSKKHSIVGRTYNINISFSDIPSIKSGVTKRYYYTNERILAVLNNNRSNSGIPQEDINEYNEHENAVKQVYEWLLSEEVISELERKDANNSAFYRDEQELNRKYDGLSNDSNFEQSQFDPTEVLAANARLVQEVVYSSIKGEQPIESQTSKLTEEMNNFIQSNERNKDIDLELYKE